MKEQQDIDLGAPLRVGPSAVSSAKKRKDAAPVPCATLAPSNCHEYEGRDFAPEDLSPRWFREYPGVETLAQTLRIAESAPDATRAPKAPLKLHWVGAQRCVHVTSPMFRPMATERCMNGDDFDKARTTEPGRMCAMCLSEFRKTDEAA